MVDLAIASRLFVSTYSFYSKKIVIPSRET